MGCNAVTGADEIVLSKKKKNGNNPGGDTPAAGGGVASGGNAASGGNGAVGGAGVGGQPIDPVPNMVPADGLSISAIAIYQGVKRPLMENGAPVTTNIPIVANRDALMRVYVAPIGGGNGQPITARLSLGSHGPLDVSTSYYGTSSDASLSSTINFQIPAVALANSTDYRVELLQPPEVSSGQNATAHYPAAGTESLPVQKAGNQIKIVLLPIRYAADGSNRLPDTSNAQLDRYRSHFYGMYPTPAVDIIVKPAMTWNSHVSAYGSGWSNLLNAVVDQRQSSGAAPDDYFYGIFAPASSFATYCSGGCVAGLSMLAGPTDYYARAGIGLGFSGDDSASTAVHEVGHMHGREHAPCGTNQGVDWSYPYSGGSIGSWGYDLVSGSLKSPTSFYDFMGYCDPGWVSDYNFKALFDRIKFVNGAFIYPATEPQIYERISIGLDGEVQWLEPLELSHPPSGKATKLTVHVGSQNSGREGILVPYGCGSGGLLLFKQPRRTPDRVTVQVEGIRHSLSR